MSNLVIPKIECVESTPTYGRIVAEPLEKGYGVTLGNVLRRVLLSSLPGAAVTWVKIDAVQHEFSTIPHMKEDTVEFLLNVKALRLRPLAADRLGKLMLQVEGEGEVCAGDIAPSADFDIVNPELHLATLDSPEAKLAIEFNVEQGKGYIPAGRGDGLPIGIIPVDAIFTPVRKVNYNVEPIRIGQEASYEQLTLEVWTDGTISAAEAVSQSADILIGQLSLFRGLVEASKKEAEKKLLRLNIPAEQYNMPVEKLGLAVRTLNSLRRGNINTVGELLEVGDKGLLNLRSFGQKSLKEVQERLRALGLIPEAPEAGAEEEPAGEVAESQQDEAAAEAVLEEGAAPEGD